MDIAHVRREEEERRRERAELERRNWLLFIYYYRRNPQHAKGTTLFQIVMTAPLVLIKKLLETALEADTHIYLRESAAWCVTDIANSRILRSAHVRGNENLIVFLREAGLSLIRNENPLIEGCGCWLVLNLVKLCLLLELGWEKFSATLTDGLQKNDLKHFDTLLVTLLCSRQIVSRPFVINFFGPCLADASDDPIKILVDAIESANCHWPYTLLEHLHYHFQVDDATFGAILQAAATTTYIEKAATTFDRSSFAIRLTRFVLIAKERKLVLNLPTSTGLCNITRSLYESGKAHEKSLAIRLGIIIFKELKQ